MVFSCFFLVLVLVQFSITGVMDVFDGFQRDHKIGFRVTYVSTLFCQRSEVEAEALPLQPAGQESGDRLAGLQGKKVVIHTAGHEKLMLLDWWANTGADKLWKQSPPTQWVQVFANKATGK